MIRYDILNLQETQLKNRINFFIFSDLITQETINIISNKDDYDYIKYDEETKKIINSDDFLN